MQVLVTQNPRQVLLAGCDVALVLQAVDAGCVTARFVPNVEDLNLQGRRFAKATDAIACLGILALHDCAYAVLATQTERIPGPTGWSGVATEDVYRVLKVEFVGLHHGLHDDAFQIHHPCRRVRQILQNGHFYFSIERDLSSRLDLWAKGDERYWQLRPVPGQQRRLNGQDDSNLRGNPTFVYNRYMLDPLLHFRNSLSRNEAADFDAARFATTLIQGYYGSRAVTIGDEPALLTVISRLCPERTGTRFNVRGIDERGNVANFAETETIVRTANRCYSMVQVRGSVPLLWTEDPSISDVLLHIQQPAVERSLEPFLRHAYELIDAYGQFHCFSLMRDVQVAQGHFNLSKEVLLNDAYSELVSAASKMEEEIEMSVSFEIFDLTEVVLARGWNKLEKTMMQALQPHVDRFGLSSFSLDTEGKVNAQLQTQKGILRVNCRDCLDRTNLGEHVISLLTFTRLLGEDVMHEGSGLVKAHRELFFESGNALALIYAGSPSMWCQFTKTGSWSKADNAGNAEAGLLRVRSFRYLDRKKEEGIDELTGHAATSRPILCLPFRD